MLCWVLQKLWYTIINTETGCTMKYHVMQLIQVEQGQISEIESKWGQAADEHHLQNSFLVFWYLRYLQMGPLKKLEPKRLIWGNNQGKLVSYINSLGFSCVTTAIHVTLDAGIQGNHAGSAHFPLMIVRFSHNVPIINGMLLHPVVHPREQLDSF